MNQAFRRKEEQQIPKPPQSPGFQTRQTDQSARTNVQAASRVSGIGKLRPFRLQAICVLIAAACLGIQLAAGGLSSRSSGNYSVSETTSAYGADTSLEYEYLNGWNDSQGNTVMVYKVEKMDPDVMSYGGSINIFNDYNSDYIPIPSLNFGVKEAIVSGILHRYSGDPIAEPDEVEVDFSDMGGVPITDYAYDNQTGQSTQKLYQQLEQDGVIRRHTIQVSDDGVADQDGVVRFTIDNPDKENFYTDINIIFKKNGKIVYGDVMSVDIPSSRTSYSGIYNAPVTIEGGYDAVEVIELNS